MKAITIWQPYASLIVLSGKRYETRSRSTNYRGPLVIHAAKSREGLKHWQRITVRERGLLMLAGIASLNDLPLGVALGIVDLVDCLPAEQVATGLTVQEAAFGDFSNGRFAWKLANVRPFPQPIPARGSQGLWECKIDFEMER